MFVLRSTYEAEHARCLELALQLQQLTLQWNNLVKRINDKGGEEFLESKPAGFSDSELKQLLSLCHPDKHDGKESAIKLTQKLLKMRKA